MIPTYINVWKRLTVDINDEYAVQNLKFIFFIASRDKITSMLVT